MKKNKIIDKKPVEIETKYKYDEYFDCFTFKMKPVSEQFINKLAHDLLQWAYNDENALKLTQFYHMKGIGSNDMKRWSKRNINLKIAHARALQMIGNRREIGALKGTLNPKIVAYTMPMYDKTWKQLVEWEASLKKDQVDEKAVRIILEEIPSSDLVPYKNNNQD